MKALSLFLILGIILVIFLKLPSENSEKSLPPVLFPVDETCFLTQNTCSRTIEKGSVTLSFPRPLPVAKTFPINLKIENIPAQKIFLKLQGVEMAMGDWSFPFTPKEKGVFEAQMMIPLCLTGKMRWRATLLIQNSEKELHIPWDFWAGGE